MVYDKIWLGVTFAAPIGAVGAEAMRRGLVGGFLPAFKVKIGAAVGDAILLVIAYYCISTILEYSILCNVLGLMGSTLLLYMGYKNITRGLSHDKGSFAPAESLRGGTLLGLGIALTNPFAIAWWLSTFSALLASNGEANSFAGLMENMYIVVGIVIWDIIFCVLLALSKIIVKESLVKNITILAGLSLCYFGLRFGSSAIINILLA